MGPILVTMQGCISSRMGPPAALCMAFIQVVQSLVDVARVHVTHVSLSLVAGVQGQVHQRGPLHLGTALC